MIHNPYEDFTPQKIYRSFLLKKEFSLTLGIIPYVREKFKASENYPFSAYIRKFLITRSNLVEVSLHGLTHDVRTYVEGKSELAGLPIEGQLKIIREGKDILEKIDAGIRKVVYTPPFDT